MGFNGLLWALLGISVHGWTSLGFTGNPWAWLGVPWHPWAGLAGTKHGGDAPISPQSLDLWCFDVFALHRVTEEHSLRTIVLELFTRHNLTSRFKVRPCPPGGAAQAGCW